MSAAIAMPASGKLSFEGLAWHEGFARALCARSAEPYLSHLHPDCSVQINNSLPVYSKLAIGRAYTSYLQTFAALSVDVLNIYGADKNFAVEAMLNYVRNDGASEVIQCAYMIDRAPDGLVTSIRVFGNATRLFKPFMRATH